MVSDQLVEDMIKQLKVNNGLQKQLIESIRKDAKRGRRAPRDSGGGGGRDSTPGRLNQLGQAASQLSSGLMNANNASEGASAMFKSIGSASKVIPLFGGAVGLAATAVQQFYEYMNGNLQTFNKLNESGLSASGGMMGLQGALASGRLSFDEFSEATTNYKDVIASMGTDGVQNFGNLMNSVIQTESSMGTLNLSNQTLASSIAGYLKQQKAYSMWDKMDKKNQSDAARAYADNLQKYSKSLGMTVDALSAKMAKSAESVTGLGLKLDLMDQGMDEQSAAATAENLNMILGSFGKFGDEMNDQLATFINTGGNLDLDSTIGQLYQVDGQFRDMFNGIANMVKNGEVSSKEGAERMRNMLADPATVKAMESSMVQFRKSFGDTAGNQLAQMIATVKNYDVDAQKATADWDDMIYGFNRSMEEMIQKFKIGTVDLITNPQQFIIDMFGEKWGKWLLTGVFGWEIGQPYDFPTLDEFLHKYFKPAGWLYDVFMGYGSEAMDRMQAIEKPSMEAIVRALVPNWLADIIFDKGNRDGGIAGAEDMKNVVKNKMNKVYDEFTTDENLDAVGKSIGEAYSNVADTASNVMKSVSDWWSKPGSQTVVSNSTINNQSSVVNKPTTVQEQTSKHETVDDLRQRELQEYNETFLGKMERLVKATSEANETNRELLRVAKETANNTANNVVN